MNGARGLGGCTRGRIFLVPRRQKRFASVGAGVEPGVSLWVELDVAVLVERQRPASNRSTELLPDEGAERLCGAFAHACLGPIAMFFRIPRAGLATTHVALPRGLVIFFLQRRPFHALPAGELLDGCGIARGGLDERGVVLLAHLVLVDAVGDPGWRSQEHHRGAGQRRRAERLARIAWLTPGATAAGSPPAIAASHGFAAAAVSTPGVGAASVGAPGVGAPTVRARCPSLSRGGERAPGSLPPLRGSDASIVRRGRLGLTGPGHQERDQW